MHFVPLHKNDCIMRLIHSRNNKCKMLFSTAVVLIFAISVNGFHSIKYSPAKLLSSTTDVTTYRFARIVSIASTVRNEFTDINQEKYKECALEKRIITQNIHKNQQYSIRRQMIDNSRDIDSRTLSTTGTSRGSFIKQTTIACMTVIAATAIGIQPQDVYAATATEPLSKEEQEELNIKRIAAFDGVRKELTTNGIPYMKQLIQEEKYEELLEFTKTYDQILRKQKMGSAKKLLVINYPTTTNENEIKSIKDRATQYSNNVTFDLIGINRSIRPNTTNQQENAMKYLQELQTDIVNFLQLE